MFLNGIEIAYINCCLNAMLFLNPYKVKIVKKLDENYRKVYKKIS